MPEGKSLGEIDQIGQEEIDRTVREAAERGETDMRRILADFSDNMAERLTGHRPVRMSIQELLGLEDPEERGQK